MLKGILTFFKELYYFIVAFLIITLITCLFVLVIYGTIVIQRFT